MGASVLRRDTDLPGKKSWNSDQYPQYKCAGGQREPWSDGGNLPSAEIYDHRDCGTDGFASITIEKAMMNSEIGFCRKVLQVFEEHDISIEHMPSGIDTMTIFVHKDEFEEKEQQVLSAIHKTVKPDHIELESILALIAVVGRGMRATRGTAGRIFSALAHAHINVKMIDQGSSELNIIIGVRHDDFKNAIRALYEIFVVTQI